MGGSNGELQGLTNRLVHTATVYGMEVSTEMSKTNSINISADVSMSGQKLEEVTCFKYPAATLCKDGTCSAEIHNRIASAMAVMAKQVLVVNTISSTSKFTLC